MTAAWYSDQAARRLIARGYLPRLAALNLAWEVAQLPLYTLWTEESLAYKTFAVLHCTLGDALIGAASLALALILGRERALPTWRWRRIIALMLVLGPGYALFSEWLNTTLFRWTYSELMPTLDLPGVRIGLSPLLQWLVLPPLALHLATRRESCQRD
jgi:hypothetical protein